MIQQPIRIGVWFEGGAPELHLILGSYTPHQGQDRSIPGKSEGKRKQSIRLIWKCRVYSTLCSAKC